ncbi:uncharacterized protein LOC118813286 [Colossoma macropomum]|uniref:uncharacterized protein LOC118813286 n=1 Tax=Colossoma macropomum TaxID=42526 RepID=UPI00186445D8|nr:uncharacterized protein LOC118813286 [Colossoma macropomum]
MATSSMVMDSHPPMNEERKKSREEVLDALENLGPYSEAIDACGDTVLKYMGSIVSQMCSSVVSQAFKWITTEDGKVLCLNLVRYFYERLTKSADSQKVDVCSGSGELHIVLVGKGSISDQTRPADCFVPLNTITDTILYPPWNCAIDAKVAYGISTGDILPEHRDFGDWTPQRPLPEVWNSMKDRQGKRVPEIILGPLTTDADFILKLTAFLNSVSLWEDRKRLIIMYSPGGFLARWLPEVTLYQIVGVIAVLLWILRSKATIHLAAGLQSRGTPPAEMEAMWQELYAYTPNGTVMTTQNMEHGEFNMLYNLLCTAFE